MKRHRQEVRKGREQAFEQTKRVFSFRCSPEAYLVGRKRQTLSWVPLLLAVLALAVKIFGLIVEINDPQDVGDDIGIVQTLLLFVIVAAASYVVTQRRIRQISAQEMRSQVPAETRP